jgi:hypothetical protein
MNVIIGKYDIYALAIGFGRWIYYFFITAFGIVCLYQKYLSSIMQYNLIYDNTL